MFQNWSVFCIVEIQVGDCPEILACLPLDCMVICVGGVLVHGQGGAEVFRYY